MHKTMTIAFEGFTKDLGSWLLLPTKIELVVSTKFQSQVFDFPPLRWQILENLYPNISHFCSRAKGYKQIHLWLKVVWVERGAQKHLRRTLGVSNVSQFLLTSFLKNVINGRRQVFQAHIFLAEIPVIWMTRAQSQMVRETCASVVSKPDVITLFCEDESRRDSGIICNPKVHVALDTCHHKYGRFSLWWICFASLPWDAIQLRDVAVLSKNRIRLRQISIL